MKTFMMINSYKNFTLKFSILIFLGIFTLSCNNNERDLKKDELELDSLSQELAKYKRSSDSLKSLIQKGDLAAKYPILFGKKFDNIPNPKKFIQSSLKEKPEKIPLKSKLGGTMAFREVKVLTEDWVLGSYGNGHS